MAAGGSLTLDSDSTDVLEVGALAVSGTLTLAGIKTVVVTSGSFTVSGDTAVVSVAAVDVFVAPRSGGLSEVFIGSGARLGADARGGPVDASRQSGGSHAGAGGFKFSHHGGWFVNGAAGDGLGCALLPSTTGQGAAYGGGGGVLRVFAGCLPGLPCASGATRAAGAVEVHGALSADGGLTGAGGSLVVRASKLLGSGVVSGKPANAHGFVSQC